MAPEKHMLKGKNMKLSRRVKPYLPIFFGEFLGTATLLFVGCAACVEYDGDPRVAHHVFALGFGAAVLLAIQIFGHITACHINPAVSITALLLRKINSIQFIVYVIAQFTGAIFGFGLLQLIFPKKYTAEGFCMTKVDGTISIFQGFLVELVITSLLCFVLCAIWDPRNSRNTDSIPIRFAFVIGILSVIGGPLTGASMNTARSFAPALFGFNTSWNDQWIYWIAPNLSAFIVVGIYKLIFSESKIEERQNEEDTALAS